MRDTLKEFLNQTYIIKYVLPTKSIKKISLSNNNDYCIEAVNENQVSDSIYYSVIDYCLNESEIDITKLNDNQIFSISNRLRYEDDSDLDSKLKYGFFGEVLLNIILIHFFKTKKIIAKGYFYSPIEKSEPKGYDIFHFIQDQNDNIGLWFGESKMYTSFSQAIEEVLKNITKALSKEYYKRNIQAILSRKSDLDDTDCKPLFLELYEKLINDSSKFMNDILNLGLKVTYPIMITFNSKGDYEKDIVNSVSIIDKKVNKYKIKNEINAEILFILLPLEDVIKVKKEVIQCISERKSMI